MIKLENISKKYGDKQVLENFSYIFPDSGFIAVTGKSGSGKTTLLNIILGLEAADTGSITFSKNSCDFGVVFQEDRLLTSESALENVLFVMTGNTREARTEKATDILVRLGLENEANEPICSLSGGMKRRVAIARCLAVDADIYIMDEPIKGLDAELQKQTLDTIHEYTDQKGKLLIMSTHSAEETAGCDDMVNVPLLN